MARERLHPILLASLAAAHTEIVDETVRPFDMALTATDANARARWPSEHTRRSRPMGSALRCSTSSMSFWT